MNRSRKCRHLTHGAKRACGFELAALDALHRAVLLQNAGAHVQQPGLQQSRADPRRFLRHPAQAEPGAGQDALGILVRRAHQVQDQQCKRHMARVVG